MLEQQKKSQYDEIEKRDKEFAESTQEVLPGDQYAPDVLQEAANNYILPI